VRYHIAVVRCRVDKKVQYRISVPMCALQAAIWQRRIGRSCNDSWKALSDAKANKLVPMILQASDDSEESSRRDRTADRWALASRFATALVAAIRHNARPRGTWYEPVSPDGKKFVPTRRTSRRRFANALHFDGDYNA
jgi:hypothetical protein